MRYFNIPIVTPGMHVIGHFRLSEEQLHYKVAHVLVRSHLAAVEFPSIEKTTTLDTEEIKIIENDLHFLDLHDTEELRYYIESQDKTMEYWETLMGFQKC